MPAARLTDVPGIATYLGYTQRQVYDLVARRGIPHVKVGRTLRFDLRRIDRWIDAQTVEAAS